MYGTCYFRVPFHRYPHTVRTNGGRTCLVLMRQAAKRDVGIPAASSLVEDRGLIRYAHPFGAPSVRLSALRASVQTPHLPRAKRMLYQMS